MQILPAQIDYFRVLGIPRCPAVDEADLAKHYYDLSRQLHPDLYQTGTVEEREASLRNTALLNRAYRTLRDPVQRGQYWLELHGERLGKDNNQVPPDLAALVFRVQEKLAEVRETRAMGDASVGQADLTAIRDELNDRIAGLQHALEENFVQWGPAKHDAELLQSLKRLLSEIAYLKTLSRDVEKESEPQWNA
jgi:molecular chaperone HscB